MHPLQDRPAGQDPELQAGGEPLLKGNCTCDFCSGFAPYS